MNKPNIKKICIVVHSLAGGGAERSSAHLSEMLYNIGYNVYVVSIINDIKYPYKGKLINLGNAKKEHSTLFRLKRLLRFKALLKKERFDYVIDNRTRVGFFKTLILTHYLFNSKNTIYCVRSYETYLYINPNRFLGKLLYKSAYKIVGVSKAISKKISADYHLDNVTTIYNPVTTTYDENLNKEKPKKTYILYYGRLLDKVKNISLLLEAYSKSKLPTNNIYLKILGSGDDEEILKLKVKLMQLNTVEFLPYQANPFFWVKNAKFTVLTSKFEGFPRVVIESLAIGTPVVSVDCQSGPKEIITNAFNGLLVENNNPIKLAKAFNTFLEDDALYLHCKANAKKSVAHLHKQQIAKHWANILK